MTKNKNIKRKSGGDMSGNSYKNIIYRTLNSLWNEHTFTTILIISALVILIFTIIALSLYLNTPSFKLPSEYPPIHNKCPDGWQQNNTGFCIVPSSNFNIGTLLDNNAAGFLATPGHFTDADGIKSINFSDPAWTEKGLVADCQQRQWALKNGVKWDTVHNFNGC